MGRNDGPQRLREMVDRLNGCGMYQATTDGRYMFVCRNDGRYHKSSLLSGKKGFATYIGCFDIDDAEKRFLMEL